jgi:hypothetical protein
MVRKSDGEKIDELTVSIATLTERLDNVREELKEFKREQDAKYFRFWMIVPPLVAAILSAGLMAIVNYLLPRH